MGHGVRESVVIQSFWRTTIRYHRRRDPKTACGLLPVQSQCGHAMPREVADKIAVPCGKCFRDG